MESLKIVLILILYPSNVKSYSKDDESKLISCYACEQYITENGKEFRREDKNDRHCRTLDEKVQSDTSTLQYSYATLKGNHIKRQTTCLFAESVGSLTESSDNWNEEITNNLRSFSRAWIPMFGTENFIVNDTAVELETSITTFSSADYHPVSFNQS